MGLKDDGVPVQQVIGIQAGIGVPLRLGVVMDTSNSERDSEVYRAALRALPKFLDDVLATDDDRVFFATVTSGAELTDFVPRTKLSGLHIDATPGGPTALFDGIAASCDQRMQKDSAGRARRVLVVISDGNDNQSHLKASEAIGFAQKTGTIVFTLSTGEHRSIESRDTAILKKLAQETGGDSFVDLSPRDVPKVLAEIVREIGNISLVTYEPAASKPGFHKIELKDMGTHKRKLLAPAKVYVAGTGA